jgi:hypothetical protein
VSKIPAEIGTKFSGWYEPINPRVEKLRFLERLLGMVRITATTETFEVRSLDKARKYVQVNDGLLRETDSPAATLALIPNAEEGVVVQTTSTTFLRISTAQAILQIALPVLVLLLMLSSLLFALIWIPRKLFRRMRGVPYLRARVYPLLAVLSLIAFSFLIFLGTDNIVLLGRVTWLSMLIFVLTIFFAFSSVWGLIVAARAPKTVKRSVRIHSLLVAIANTIATVYLFYWGIIGWRTWA